MMRNTNLTMKPTIYVIHGASRSGKNTVYEYLSELSAVPIEECKFSAAMKRDVETSYGLVQGSMEIPEFRAMQVPGKPDGYTFLDLMVEAYHNCNWICDNIWIPGLMRSARHDLETGLSVAFTDIRKLSEAYHVTNLAGLINANLIYIYVTRDEANVLTSDGAQDDIRNIFSFYAHISVSIENNGTLADLRHETANLMEFIYAYASRDNFSTVPAK